MPLATILGVAIYVWLLKKLKVPDTSEILKKKISEYIHCEDILCFP
jgi:hypothetical protein